ncbi:MAG: helix-turn-helix transcriptional regulator [Chitinophagales bacterium]
MSDGLRELVTLEELRQRLKVSRATVFRLKEKGMPSVKVGGALRFDPKAVDEWIRLQGEVVKATHRPHMPGHLRERLIEAFDETRSTTEKEWWEVLESPDEARNLIGALWNCRDIAPASLREDVADWILHRSLGNEELAKRLRSGCSFAQLVRAIRPHLEEDLRNHAEAEGASHE